MSSSSSAWSVGGTSNIYELDLCTGKPVRTIDDPNGEDPNGEGTSDPSNPNRQGIAIAGSTLSHNSAGVGFINIGLPNGETKTIATTADGKTVTHDHNPAVTMPTRRTGWRRVRE